MGKGSSSEMMEMRVTMMEMIMMEKKRGRGKRREREGKRRREGGGGGEEKQKKSRFLVNSKRSPTYSQLSLVTQVDLLLSFFGVGHPPLQVPVFRT